MFDSFFPDEWLDSAYAVDYEALYREGIRGLLFDIDNTLVPHGAPADERARALFQRLKKIGFRSCFISNNQRERVESFNTAVGEQFVENAHKPSRNGYLRGMALVGSRPETTVFIGDQLFTDIWGARRTGIRTILVKPIHPKEEIQIVLKRRLERIVLYFYQRRRLNRQTKRRTPAFAGRTEKPPVTSTDQGDLS